MQTRQCHNKSQIIDFHTQYRWKAMLHIFSCFVIFSKLVIFVSETTFMKYAIKRYKESSLMQGDIGLFGFKSMNALTGQVTCSLCDNTCNTCARMPHVSLYIVNMINCNFFHRTFRHVLWRNTQYTLAKCNV